jgi:hypothetical protein
MLGDAGGNALGGMLGAGIVYSSPSHQWSLGLLAGLVALTALAERPGFTAVLARVPGLREFDRAGRVREDARSAVGVLDSPPGVR